VPFYVPLGIRGVLFHIGGLTTRAYGSLIYWWSVRRRLVRFSLTLAASDS